MAEVPADGEDRIEQIDVCTTCQFVWFDTSEYESLPTIPDKIDTNKQLPSEAREKLAILELDAIREEARGDEWGKDAPDMWWQQSLLNVVNRKFIEKSHKITLEYGPFMSNIT